MLQQPLTKEEMKQKMDEEGYICEEVTVDLHFLIENDESALLEHLSRKVTGTTSLMDIEYKSIGVNGLDSIIMLVGGSVKDILNLQEM